MTNDERRMIGLLEDNVYNVDFMEEWISSESASVSLNPVAALQQSAALGFMAAVRCLLKDDVRHSIYREVYEENMIEDIKSRLYDMEKDDLGGIDPDDLANNKDFLGKVFHRWEKSLGWCDTAYDTYWDCCDNAIKGEIPRKE